MKFGLVVLAGVIAGWLGWTVGETAVAENLEPPKGGVGEIEPIEAVAEPVPPRPEVSPAEAAAVDWPALFDGPDMRPLVLALREAGFSGQAIRSWLGYVVYLRQEQAWLNYLHPNSDRWWETINHRDQDMVKVFELQLEARRIVDELMFDEPETELEKLRRLVDWGGLPREKVDAIKRISAEFEVRVVEASRGDPGPNWYREIQTAKLAAIRSVLSPTEYRDYITRNSSAAGLLKTKTRFLDLNEEQFSIAAWETHQFEVAAEGAAFTSTEDQYQMGKAGVMAQRKIWTAFGDELYFQFTRRDAGREPPQPYTGLVPPQKILNGMEINFRLTESLAEIYGSYAADNPLRFDLLTEAYHRHVAEVQLSMTPAEFEAYRKSPDGRWVDAKRPKPTN